MIIIGLKFLLLYIQTVTIHQKTFYKLSIFSILVRNPGPDRLCFRLRESMTLYEEDVINWLSFKTHFYTFINTDHPSTCDCPILVVYQDTRGYYSTRIGSGLVRRFGPPPFRHPVRSLSPVFGPRLLHHRSTFVVLSLRPTRH